MIFISKNIKYLLQKEGLGKDAFGKLFGLNRGTIGSYIEGKSNPKIETIQKIANRYNLLIDDVVNRDLANQDLTLKPKTSLNDFSHEEIIKYLYTEDEELSKNPLLWMYLKMKFMDERIKQEESKVKDLEEHIKTLQLESQNKKS
ncbi:helix-turn-helix transcriptional regulator [Aquimarina rhabdastrellae]